jgi:hypothetical protein
VPRPPARTRAGADLQLLRWVPLTDVATPALLDFIFRFAALSDPGTVGLGTAAMGCVNEVLARSCIPRDLQEFLVHIYRYAYTCACARVVCPLLTGRGVRAHAAQRRWARDEYPQGAHGQALAQGLAPLGGPRRGVRGAACCVTPRATDDVD